MSGSADGIDMAVQPSILRQAQLTGLINGGKWRVTMTQGVAEEGIVEEVLLPNYPHVRASEGGGERSLSIPCAPSPLQIHFSETGRSIPVTAFAALLMASLAVSLSDTATSNPSWSPRAGI